MNIVERARSFRQSLQALAQRTTRAWQECPHCGSWLTIKNGSYQRHPWHLSGRVTVRVQRHLCQTCGRSYGEQAPQWVRGSWYGRDVQRAAVDHWQHLGLSLRRTAEVLRSWLGRQERWPHWRPWEAEAAAECHLAASTVYRWLDRAGCAAQASVAGQLSGLGGPTRVVGVDGLWVRLHGQARRVVLLLVDSVSGLMYPPVVMAGEETAAPWQGLFARAEQAGLTLATLRGVPSDGAVGLADYLRRHLGWVQQQRCVWHLWRNLARPLAQASEQAAAALSGEAAQDARRQTRHELGRLIHQVIDARDHSQAEAALAALRGHPRGTAIGQLLNEQFDRLLVHLLAYYQGLQRVTPEWYWRDFRLRHGHGRNHGSEQRLERAALVWAIYHNFEPAQWRCERKRHYRHPGQSALQVAGVPPELISYLDALGV